MINTEFLEGAALPCLWRGGDGRLRSSALVVAGERLRRRIYVPVLFVVLLEIRGSKILSLGHLCLSDSFDFPVVRISEVMKFAK